jgi:hypothetical protein
MARSKSGQRRVTTPENGLLPQCDLPDLERTVNNFADRLRSEFCAEIRRDVRGFKRRVVRLLAAALSPGPGRPRNDAVTLALELRSQGRSWQAIYARCIPPTLADDSRQVAESRLRCAVRSRRIARRRTKPATNS